MLIPTVIFFLLLKSSLGVITDVTWIFSQLGSDIEARIFYNAQIGNWDNLYDYTITDCDGSIAWVVAGAGTYLKHVFTALEVLTNCSFTHAGGLEYEKLFTVWINETASINDDIVIKHSLVTFTLANTTDVTDADVIVYDDIEPDPGVFLEIGVSVTETEIDYATFKDPEWYLRKGNTYPDINARIYFIVRGLLGFDPYFLKLDRETWFVELRETPGNTGFSIPILGDLVEQTFSRRRNIEAGSGENILTGNFFMPSESDPNGGIPFGGEYEYIYFQFEVEGSRRRSVSTVVSLNNFNSRRTTTNITDPLAIYEAMILDALEEIEEEIEEEVSNQFTVVYIVVASIVGTLFLCIFGVAVWVFYIQKKQQDLKEREEEEGEEYSEMM
jgi:hypothetical protein